MSIEYSFDLHMEHLQQAAADAKTEGLAHAAEHIRQVSSTMVPIGETGNLVGSAGVKLEGNEATVYYDTVYAHYQHEGISKNGHPLRYERPGAQAKFLEQPMNTEAQKALEIIATSMRRALG